MSTVFTRQKEDARRLKAAAKVAKRIARRRAKAKRRQWKPEGHEVGGNQNSEPILP